MTDEAPLPSRIAASSRWLIASGVALAGLTATAMAAGPIVLWCGLATAVLPGAMMSLQFGRSRSGLSLSATALGLVAVGLVMLSRDVGSGAIPLIAGGGALAGWLPFCWSSSTPSMSQDGNSGFELNLASLGLRLIGMTAALVAAARFVAAGLAQNSPAVEPVLFLAAAVTLVVASARAVSSHQTLDAILAFTGMAACGIAADVALRRGTSTLPVSVVRGDVAGMLVWLHGTTMLVLYLVLTTNPDSETPSSGRVKAWLITLVAADIAGLPPLPGFWTRGNLLMSLVSRQTASSITGEYEPHAGMLMLAILVTITWGAIMTKAFSMLADLNDRARALS